MELPIELICTSCGTKTLEVSGDRLTDESIVTCTTCGTGMGTWKEVKEASLRVSTNKMKEKLNQALGDSFKPN